MVQVDVFWSYGIGAGFAVANTLQLETQQNAGKTAYEHTSFRDALLYLGALFVPSGAFLIWQFPSWETMHVATRDDIPGWLMAAFTLTNFTQGVLGFAVAAALLRRKQHYAAYLQWLLGYFGLLFILVHGWDGTGYMRFLSSTREEFVHWSWATAQRWLTGDVFHSLLAMGIVILPVMFGVMARDLRRGYKTSGYDERAGLSTIGLALSLFAALVPGVLGAAILASVAIRYLGPLIGVPAFAVTLYLVGLRRGSAFHRHFRHVVYGESLLARSGRVLSQKRPPSVSESTPRV
jgi:hypothetical protein